MESNRALEVALQLIRYFEGCYLRPYLCPAGVPTIGYGATYYEDGRRVSLKDLPITQEQALQLLEWQVRTVYLPTVLRLCQGAPDMTPGRLAALIDFCFNLGGSNLRASTLLRRVRAGRWEEVPDEYRKWVKAAGRTLRGLVRRREAEAALTWFD